MTCTSLTPQSVEAGQCPANDLREAVLAALRIERLRLQLTLGDIDMLGVALLHGCVTAEQAVVSMLDLGLAVPSPQKGRAAA